MKTLMNRVYDINSSFLYYNILLNNEILKSDEMKYNFDGTTVPESLLVLMVQNIKKCILEQDIPIIIDFTGVEKMDILIEHYDILLNNKIILFNLSESLYAAFTKKAENKNIQNNYQLIKDDERKLFTYFVHHLFDEYEIEIFKRFVNKTQSKTYLYAQFEFYSNMVGSLIKFCLDKYEEKPKYLMSSNVYTNTYINIKKLFTNNNYLELLIWIMALKIDFKYLKTEKMSDIILIGVSNNGSILAMILSYVLNVEVEFINRVGPKYCVENYLNISNKNYGKKYLLITDVICLGTEYKITKAILNSHGANLKGCLSVVKVHDTYRDENRNMESDIDSLVWNINNHILNYEYHLLVNEKEGNNDE